MSSGRRSNVGRTGWTRLLAYTLGGFSAAMFVLAGVFTLLALIAGDESLLGMASLLLFLPFLAFPVVGTVIASKRPGNSIGWVCLVAGTFWMAIGLAEQFEAYRMAAFGEDSFMETYHGLSQGLWVIPVGLLGVYMVLLFPDGKLPSAGWRPLAWSSGVIMAVITVGITFLPGPLANNPDVDNPFGLESLAWATDVAIFVILLLPACIIASAASLVFRFRRAKGEVRQQIKWLALAACFVGLSYLGGLLAQLLLVPDSLRVGGATEPAWVSLLNSLTTIGYASVPVAVGFAVLKYRLYDIEIIINRALVYGSLTVFLVLVYFSGVAGLQRVLFPLVGEDSQLAIVASTLVIAALFNPLRRRIQSFIDRRFYRGKYDAERTLDDFSKRLRDETDLETLRGDLHRVVRDTVQPAHVSLWLRETTERKA